MANTPDPSAVTIAGSLQDELGCPGDWQPDCADTQLVLDSDDAVWQRVLGVPAGSYEYKAALNNGWDENYGANAAPGGANIPLELTEATDVKFYYSHETHWVTDDLSSTIAVAPGSFQSELGCASDWDPGCLRSWLQDPDGDGVLSFVTSSLPAGDYEAKVTIGESWDVNYGAGGVQNGPNIPFTVPADCAAMQFAFDLATMELSIGPAPEPAQPASVTIAGSLQDELGCPGDWQPDCAASYLAYDAEDGAWQEVFTLPAGSYEYKATINGSWDENYGANATPGGANIPLNLADAADVKLYYSHETHWVTDSLGAVIATVPGSFQSELGCSNDWDPSCLRSWLQDPDGDGIYSFSARLPAGSYEGKVAINESWDLNYGEGGAVGGANIAFTVAGACSLVFFTWDSTSHVLTIGSAPGGPTGNLNKAQAYWVSEDTIAWDAGSAVDTYTLHYDPDGNLTLDETGVVGGMVLPLTRDPAGLPAAVTEKFPHLSGLSALRLGSGDLGMVPDILKGRIAVAVAAADGTPIDATSLQIPGVLDDLYTYDGDLGVSFDGHIPTLRVWAPTARSVALMLYDDPQPDTTASVYTMTLDPASGVWSVSGEWSWNRKYYLYDVEVYVPSTAQVEHNLVSDPYSLSLSANSARSQIVNLDDQDLKPAGWHMLRKPELDAPEDIVVYELHVRDFSIADPSVPAHKRGTYRAFGRFWSQGMRHLRALAQAGLTHVHLLPAFDIATVPERAEDQLTVDQALLASLPPDSDQQQALIEPIKDMDGFNWGYDPWHYTVPEGSYATDPDGLQRIREFREMVVGLSWVGLRVVMDVVYNHTNAAGQNSKSVLDRIVPGYYHRLGPTGAIETSSCCPNTAAEHAMMEKLMIDSIVTWARDYKVDGFRFDLMGHHPRSTLLAIRAALDALTLEHDGVDGSSIYLYGEGWNFGEVANNARFVQATQANMAGTGIGTFSDRLRDGVRGGNPFSDVREQGFINGLCYDPSDYETAQGGDACAELRHISDWIRIGLAGDLADYMLIDADGNLVRADEVDYFGQQAGYTADPQENIKYITAHDNETLFDAIQLKAPLWTAMADRVRMQNLGASLVLLGQGIPFLHAGQDILRSKSMDRDSFNSGDWFNQIDWSLATSNWGHGLPVAEKNQDKWPIMQPLLADPDMAPAEDDMERANDHVREMLAIRRSSPLFRLRTADDVLSRVTFHNTGPGQIPGLIVMSISDADGGVDRAIERIVTLFNAGTDEAALSLAELAGTSFQLHPVLRHSSDPVVGGASYDAASGTFTVPARTTAVFVAQRSVSDQIALLIADIDALEAAGVLSGAEADALRSRVDASLGSLFAFKVRVWLLIWNHTLTSEQGEALITAADALIAAI